MENWAHFQMGDGADFESWPGAQFAVSLIFVISHTAGGMRELRGGGNQDRNDRAAGDGAGHRARPRSFTWREWAFVYALPLGAMKGWSRWERRHRTRFVAAHLGFFQCGHGGSVLSSVSAMSLVGRASTTRWGETGVFPAGAAECNRAGEPQ